VRHVNPRAALIRAAFGPGYSSLLIPFSFFLRVRRHQSVLTTVIVAGAEVFVRGEVLNSGWAIEPFDDGDDASYRDRDGADEMSSAPEEDNREEVYCTYVVCVDLRGLVPNWVVNMFQARDVHAAFAQLKQQAEDQRGHAAAATNAPPSSPTATATLEMT
jgi:hypothetical protein